MMNSEEKPQTEIKHPNKPDELEPTQKPEVDPKPVHEIPTLPSVEIEPGNVPDEIVPNTPDEI